MVNRRHIPLSKVFRNPIALLAAGLLATAVLGCAAYGGGDGRLGASREVTDLFRSYQVLPDHVYYYTGPDAYPTVVMAVHKDYTLSARFWKPVEATPRRLRDWFDWARTTTGLYSYQLYGSWIMGPEGQCIGVWFPYRYRGAWGRITLRPDGSVSITTPAVDPPEPMLRFRLED